MIETDGRTCIITVDRQQIDVVDFYQRTHHEIFKKLPPVLTMTGGEIYNESKSAPTWRMYLEAWNGKDEPVSHLKAYPLLDGMKFYTIPFAWYY